VQKKILLPLAGIVAVMGFMLGFNISNNTGVEPGFFEIAEAGGYGAGAESNVPEGLSKDLQDYYSDLAED